VAEDALDLASKDGHWVVLQVGGVILDQGGFGGPGEIKHKINANQVEN
jgi:hypothetical protein